MPTETMETVYICRMEPMRTDVRRRTTDGSRRQPREVGRKPAKTNYIYTSDVVSPPSSPIESEDVAGERQLVGHVEPAQDVTDDVESCRPPPSLERVNAHVPSTPSCMHMRAITHALAHVHTQAVSHTYIHTYIHTCTQLHMCAHACQNSGIRSLTYVSTHIGTCTQTYTHMRTHTTQYSGKPRSCRTGRLRGTLGDTVGRGLIESGVPISSSRDMFASECPHACVSVYVYICMRVYLCERVCAPPCFYVLVQRALFSNAIGGRLGSRM